MEIIMKIDCTNLPCPEPVIKTKKTLDSLADDSTLEVIVNSKSSKENITRFAKNAGYTTSDEVLDDGTTKITIVKGYTCSIATNENNSGFLNKTLFLKDDTIGDYELGSKLMIGFLKSILELPKLPKNIICVNKAVFLTTAPADSEVITIMKTFEENGVQIYSCGVCLDFYKKENELKVGVIGNAFDTVEMLLNSEGTVTL
jgi:selenium metabolism protein YedF